jgi:hypothetical protein
LFLGALWNTDGSVDVFEEHRRGVHQKVRIAYVTRSERLARDLQQLLDQFGLDSTCRRSSVLYLDARRDVWTVKIVGREMKRRFFELVASGELPLIKYDDAFLARAREAVKLGDDRRVPRELLSEAERETLARGGRHGASFHVDSLRRFGFGETAIEQLDVLRWVQVEHVFIDGREMTYDVSMSHHHNFVAEGIVTHNTTRTITDDLIEGYQLDQQILGQAWLMENCVDLERYAPFGGVEVNITTKHKLPRHERVAVTPSRYHLSEFEESIRHWNSLEREFEKRNWPKALGNCAGPARYWSRCDFYNVCYGMPNATVKELAALDAPPYGFRRATEEDISREERLEE